MTELKLIIEALLMHATEPLSLEQLQGVFPQDQKPSLNELIETLNQLAVDYDGRAIELQRLASGYCLQTKTEFSAWISRLYPEKPAKYSRALIEVLAIIAYRQPLTRADIEDIRGVSLSTSILKTLMEREWIKIAGYRDVPGKPAVYTTTKAFLDYFNLTRLSDLPLIEEITEPSIEECNE